MTATYDVIDGNQSILAGKSLEELLLLVADDDLGYRSEAMSSILSMGIATVYPALDRGVREGNDANLRNGAMDVIVAFGRESLPYLIKLLRDTDEEVRNFAAVMLGDIGNRDAAGALIKALSDKDVNVSHSAAEALGKIGDRSALFPLMELLKDEFWVQYSAITALGAMRDYRAVPKLIELIDDEMLSGVVINALGQIGDPRALYPLGKMLPKLDMVVAGQAARAMMDIYRAATDSLSYKNSLADYHQPEHIKKVIDDAALEKLRSLLVTSSEIGVLEAVIMILGWCEDLPSISKFFDLLKDESLMDAVESSIFSFGHSALKHLNAALEHDNDNVKIIAMRTLRYLNSAGNPGVIAKLLRSANAELQLEAVEMAKSCPDNSYLAILLDLLVDGSVQIVSRVAEALGSYRYASLKEFIHSLSVSDRQERRMVGAMLICHIREPDASRLLTVLIRDSSADVRKIAIKAAGIQKVADAVSMLAAALHDTDNSVRVAAVMAIGDFRSPLLVPDLLTMLPSGDEQLDYAIIKSLGMMEAKDAEAPLVEILERGGVSRRIEYSVLETLGKISAASASDLIRRRYLVSPDPDIRRLAVETLGQLGDKHSIQAVESALQDDHWSVRVAALHVLGKLGGVDEIPQLLETINDHDDMVRKHAILVLGELRSVSAIPNLVHLLADPDMGRHAFVSLLKFGKQALPWLHRHMMKNYTTDVRVGLIDLIGKIGDRKSVDPLMDLLDDPSPAVRLAAIDSLAFCFDGMLLKKLSSIYKNDGDEEVKARAHLALKTLSMEKYN